MDYKPIIQQFKAKLPEGPTEPTVLILLMKELVDNGLVATDISGNFYQEVATEFFQSNNPAFIGNIADALILLSQTVPLPKVVEVPVETPKKNKTASVAVIENDIVRTEHLVASMPNEDDEGDPYYIPPEERIALRPEDCDPVQYDEEFCAFIGANIKRPIL